jgi:glycosyltransferase involved in cell wall biosynthesis
MSRVLGQGVSGVGLDVGFLCASWWPAPGGIETHARALARGLIERGHRVHVLCVERDGSLGAWRTADDVREGVAVRRMGAGEAARALCDLVVDPRAIDVVLAWLAEVPCDVIHALHTSGLAPSALQAVSDMGRPLVLGLHDHWLLCPCGQPLHDVHDPAARLACARRHWPQLLPSGGGEARGPRGETLADDGAAERARFARAGELALLAQRVVAPAPGVLAAHGVAAPRGVVIEHGFDAARLRAAVEAERALAPRTDGELRVGVLGSLLPAKGVVTLARALREVSAPGLVLELHGPQADFHGERAHLDELRALAAADARLRLCGAYAHDDLARVLARLDIVAAPAEWDEVYGLSVREARAAGLGVLVSARGALPAATDGGSAGLVLPAGDVRAWSAALRRCVAEPELVAAWRAAPAALRDERAMLLEHERLYAELTLAVTGRLPALAHAIPGVTPQPVPPAAAPPARGGLLGRLFGRDRRS